MWYLFKGLEGLGRLEGIVIVFVVFTVLSLGISVIGRVFFFVL